MTAVYFLSVTAIDLREKKGTLRIFWPRREGEDDPASRDPPEGPAKS
jgi:hypothetical protein